MKNQSFMKNPMLMKILDTVQRYLIIFSYFAWFTVIIPFIGFLWYLWYQDYFNIWTLTLIEKYEHREWKIPYHFFWYVWSVGKIEKKKLNSVWYFWPFHYTLASLREPNKEYVFFESWTTLKVLSKWHKYRESSSAMDQWSDFNIYLLEDSYWKHWTTIDFTVDDPYNFWDPLERTNTEYILFETLFRFKELYMLVSYNASNDANNVRDTIKNIFPRNTYKFIDNPMFGSDIDISERQVTVYIKTYEDLTQILTANASSTLKYPWYLRFIPLHSYWWMLSKFIPK